MQHERPYIGPKSVAVPIEEMPWYRLRNAGSVAAAVRSSGSVSFAAAELQASATRSPSKSTFEELREHANQTLRHQQTRPRPTSASQLTRRANSDPLLSHVRHQSAGNNSFFKGGTTKQRASQCTHRSDNKGQSKTSENDVGAKGSKLASSPSSCGAARQRPSSSPGRISKNELSKCQRLSIYVKEPDMTQNGWHSANDEDLEVVVSVREQASPEGGYEPMTNAVELSSGHKSSLALPLVLTSSVVPHHSTAQSIESSPGGTQWRRWHCELTQRVGPVTQNETAQLSEQTGLSTDCCNESATGPLESTERVIRTPKPSRTVDFNINSSGSCCDPSGDRDDAASEELKCPRVTRDEGEKKRSPKSCHSQSLPHLLSTRERSVRFASLPAKDFARSRCRAKHRIEDLLRSKVSNGRCFMRQGTPII